MTVAAVRTLLDGTAAESRESPMGRGWFGVIPEPGVDHKRVELDHEVVLLVDHDGHVAAVSWPDGKVTDSVLFSVLRSLRFETPA